MKLGSRIVVKPLGRREGQGEDSQRAADPIGASGILPQLRECEHFPHLPDCLHHTEGLLYRDKWSPLIPSGNEPVVVIINYTN